MRIKQYYHLGFVRVFYIFCFFFTIYLQSAPFYYDFLDVASMQL